MNLKARILPVLMIITVIAGLCFSAEGDSGGNDFEVRRIGNIHPYAYNAFRIRTSEPGSLEIRIHDSICVYRTISEEIPSGETIIQWDGCGYNREKLYEKTYTVTAELKAAGDKISKVSFDSPVEYPSQCLQYALPSSDTLYLDSLRSWFIEFRTVSNGKVIMELESEGGQGHCFSYSVSSDGGKIARKSFVDLSGKKPVPEPGKYMLSVYEATKPEEKYTSSLTVAKTAPVPAPITVTGEIMADRSMSDSEIWELMMKPSVVIDIDSFSHQEVYAYPDPGSPSLGTLHGQSQGLKVIRIEESWAFVGAWNHEEAAYVEGWVPLDKLKTEAPRGEYGLLIDKQKQTMTVYRNGQVIDTLLVSTGRSEKNSLYQETSAGCFLTGYHRVNFSMNGKKYDYVIQYDGGNLLHQTPYNWGQQKKDFTLGRGYLGAKASHACIRIQPEPGEGGINAYWLFTHLPYHTRVMILDDPWEHNAVAAKLKRSGKADVDLAALRPIEDADSGDTVSITFGGSVIPGGNGAVNSRKDSFSAFLKKNGCSVSFSGLKELFSSDDLTFVSLSGVILGDSKSETRNRQSIYGVPGTEQIFDGSSVELVGLTEERTVSAGEGICDETAGLLKPYTDVIRTDQSFICSLKGHLFGFTACSENEYLKNPKVIELRIGELMSAGCERSVILLSWSEEHDENAHSIVQEAMAHRSVRAGADLVIGLCPGAVQGIDFIEDIPVVYSLGDLICGNTSKKTKTQQGILVRAEFSFDKENNIPDVSIIPILPCGSSGASGNDYTPSASLNAAQAERIIRYIWQDSTDSALERIRFSIPGQS